MTSDALRVHVARGSSNRKLTGLPPTPSGAATRDSRIWVVNPVGIFDGPAEPAAGRSYELCPRDCVHLPTRFGGRADADCYADGPILWTADKVPGIPAAEALELIVEGLESGRCEALRWAVVGDLGRTREVRELTRAFLVALRAAADERGAPLIEYTHAWRYEPAHSPEANASCDRLEDVPAARAAGYQPVYVAADLEAGEAAAAELGGLVCPDDEGRASGCFGGVTTRTDGLAGCAASQGGTIPCATDRGGDLLVLLALGKRAS